MNRYIITAARLNPATKRFEKCTVYRSTREEARTAQWSMMRAGWSTNCRDTQRWLTVEQREAIAFAHAAREFNAGVAR